MIKFFLIFRPLVPNRSTILRLILIKYLFPVSKSFQMFQRFPKVSTFMFPRHLWTAPSFQMFQRFPKVSTSIFLSFMFPRHLWTTPSLTQLFPFIFDRYLQELMDNRSSDYMFRLFLNLFKSANTYYPSLYKIKLGFWFFLFI